MLLFGPNLSCVICARGVCFRRCFRNNGVIVFAEAMTRKVWCLPEAPPAVWKLSHLLNAGASVPSAACASMLLGFLMRSDVVRSFALARFSEARMLTERHGVTNWHHSAALHSCGDAQSALKCLKTT